MQWSKRNMDILHHYNISFFLKKRYFTEKLLHIKYFERKTERLHMLFSKSELSGYSLAA
jgi:hypothetical protein